MVVGREEKKHFEKGFHSSVEKSCFKDVLYYSHIQYRAHIFLCAGRCSGIYELYFHITLNHKIQPYFVKHVVQS